MKTKYYMHLMDNAPAFFDEEQGCIYFCSNHSEYNVLVNSLYTIKKQREISQQYDKDNGMKFTYSHMIVRLPE